MAVWFSAVASGYPCRVCGQSIKRGEMITRMGLARFVQFGCHPDSEALDTAMKL